MDIINIASQLRKMYDEGAKNKEQVAMIHLFGIKYASIIEENKYSINEILKYAQMRESYHTEIRKGMNLSKYVIISKDI